MYDRVQIPESEFWLYSPENPGEVDGYHVVSGPFDSLEAAKAAYLLLMEV